MPLPPRVSVSEAAQRVLPPGVQINEENVLRAADIIAHALNVASLDVLTLNRARLVEVALAPLYEADGVDVHTRDASNDFKGATTLLAKSGVHRDVLGVDISAFYPSLVLGFGLDPLGGRVLPRLMARLRALRDAVAQSDPFAAKILKMLANSFIGAIMSETCALFRHTFKARLYECAREVFEFLRSTMAEYGDVVMGTVDSVYVALRVDAKVAFENIQKKVVERYPFIRISCEARFVTLVVFATNNYVGYPSDITKAVVRGTRRPLLVKQRVEVLEYALLRLRAEAECTPLPEEPSNLDEEERDALAMFSLVHAASDEAPRAVVPKTSILSVPAWLPPPVSPRVVCRVCGLLNGTCVHVPDVARVELEARRAELRRVQHE